MGTTWGEGLCPSAFALGTSHTLGEGYEFSGDKGENQIGGDVEGKK